MSNDASSVLTVARGELGYSRYGDAMQGTKYGRWYAQSHGAYFGRTGVPYCAMFVSWVFAQAGAKCAGLPNAAAEYVKRGAAGHIRGDKRAAQPGDVILFDWGDGGWADHVGIVESNHGTYVQTIEGNVSGGVYRRNRGWSTVVAVVAPSYDAPKPTPKPSGAPSGAVSPKASPLAIDGVFGPVTVKATQTALRRYGYYGGALDGSWGPWSKRAMQRYLAAHGTYGGRIDGDFGPMSTRALQQHLLNLKTYWYDGGWCSVDGSWGRLTTIGLQRAIDASLL